MAATESTAEEDSDGDDDALQALPVSGAVACTMTVAILGLKVAVSHNFPLFWIGLVLGASNWYQFTCSTAAPELLPSWWRLQSTMQPRFLLLAVATFLIAGTAFADHMVFNGESSQSNVWQGYWTSPYLATDQTSGESLTIYCLDFNHEVAPPFSWEATIRPLDPNDVTLFQYGLSADAWQHYAAAASLFQDIQTLQVTKPADANLLETEYQVAAWELFVDDSHKDELNTKITNTGGTFETDVTKLYADALGAGSSTQTEPGWFAVTSDPQNGVPVQEFLIHQDPPPVPEPAAILLLATVVGLLGLRMRSGRPAQFR